MKTVKRFINELTGTEFVTKDKARSAEAKSKGINRLFSFWNSAPKDDSCDFANGHYCYQRTELEFSKLIDTIILAVKEFEPWIYEEYKEHGGLKKEYVIGHTFLGRYLDDGNSELYHWWGIQGDICPKCYRQYGQMFYATHCNCNGTVKKYSKNVEVETR